MSIKKIKDVVFSNLGKTIGFKVNGSRNQIEEFDGKIVNVYPALFTVKSLNNGMIRSFSYVDILTGDLELIF